MLKITRDAGATVVRDGPEAKAWLKLPPNSISSQVGELVGHQIAELNHQFKLHAQRLSTWLKTAPEAKAHMGQLDRAIPG